uniref:SPARC_Ca_bdg domain-containing protein n=1 Tax=Heterorhabditis bacteriophora TaxID=37862 RepID=A0A1I7XRG2_HETBA
MRACLVAILLLALANCADARKVCANNNETFTSLCDLYRERCFCKKGSKKCEKKSHAKAVSHHELIPITAPVIPMESCIKPFLEGCDVDSDGNISIKEWGKCLGLKEGEIQERC